MDVSFQLYSSRTVESQAEFLKTLAGIGYTQVEGFAAIYPEAQSFRTALDDAGMKMPSGHFHLKDLETDFSGQMAIAKTLGMEQMHICYLALEDGPLDSAGYASIAKRLNAVNEKIHDAGLTFGWHNHDFELVPLADGGIPMEILLTEAPEVTWEADLAWVARGNADPAEWVNKFGSRLTSVHVKDLAPTGEKQDEDGWADVGEGTLDWSGLVKAVRAVAPNALMVMEHDKPSDVLRFATTSFNNFSKY